MSRKEYLDRLMFLLQDIPDNEKKEALEYYTGYFEDAGEGEEEHVIATLGSPEKVAAMIKYDLDGVDREAGEYSEKGYQDTRFGENNKVPEVRETYKQSDTGREYRRRETYSNYNGQNGQNGYNDRNAGRGQKRGLSSGWIILLCILAVPVGIPILATAFALVVAVLATAFALVAAAAGIMFVFIVCGILMIISGIASLIAAPANALLLGGGGLLMLALGILMVLACVMLVGKFVPWLVRGIVDLIGKIFRRGGSMA